VLRERSALDASLKEESTLMHKLRKIIVTILIVLFISACGQGDIQRVRSVEEPAVYSALINDQLGVDFSYLMGDPIIIINSSEYETIEDGYLLSELKSVDKATLEDFKTANQISQPLGMQLSVNKAYEYIAWPTDENGWTEFEQKYPDAISITTLSKVGFNKRLDQALVYMAYYCGNECGSANIYFLVREGDIWKVEGSVNVWMS
jgi:hypothetical protein